MFKQNQVKKEITFKDTILLRVKEKAKSAVLYKRIKNKSLRQNNMEQKALTLKPCWLFC